VLAVWPGQADASYLMGLMAHDRESRPRDHPRQAGLSGAARPAVYFSGFAEMCRQAGLLAAAEQAARRAVALAPNHVAALNNLGIIILQEELKLDEASSGSSARSRSSRTTPRQSTISPKP
jgi:hypothetical protein